MRRVIVIIAAFLIVGAIVNIAIAWGCAAWSEVGRTVTTTFDGTTATHKVMESTQILPRVTAFDPAASSQPAAACQHYAGPGIDRLCWIDGVETVPGKHGMLIARTPKTIVYDCRQALREDSFDWEPLSVVDDSAFPLAPTFIIEDFTGWPCRALAGHAATSQQFSRAGAWLDARRSNAIFLSWKADASRFGDYRALPLRPLWPGFLINTLFYAAMIWLFLAAVTGTRRMIRRRRGLCPKCAYPIGASPVCTECGAALARRSEPRP